MANSSCWWASRQSSYTVARRLTGGNRSPSDAPTVAPHPTGRDGGFRYGIAENSRTRITGTRTAKGPPAGGLVDGKSKTMVGRPRESGDPVAFVQKDTGFPLSRE